jgi:hypothetical protein
VFPGAIFRLKLDLLNEMYNEVNIPSTDDTITELFGGTEWENQVRYINVVSTFIDRPVTGMYIIDGFCHLFTGESNGNALWYKFDASLNYIQ